VIGFAPPTSNNFSHVHLRVILKIVSAVVKAIKIDTHGIGQTPATRGICEAMARLVTM
jgi:hypothetical protein